MIDIIRRYKKTLWAKLAVFFVSLFVCLVILEIGLRATGWAIQSSRETDFMAAFDEEGADYDYVFERYRSTRAERLIVTLGDSLTNGTNVSDRETYPYYLYNYFAEAGRKVSVYNMGYCQDTTSGAYSKLKNYLARPDARVPDAAVLLVGAADLFHLPLLGQRAARDSWTFRDALPTGWFGELRTVKVLSHILFNLPLWVRGRGLRGDEEPATEAKLAKLLAIYEARKGRAGGGADRGLDAAAIKEMSALFAEQLGREKFNLRRLGQFLEFTADYAYEVYARQGRHDKLFSLLLDMAGAFPRTFWGRYLAIGDRYFPLSFNRQSKYTPADALRVLDKAAAEYPELLKLEPFVHYRGFFRDRGKTERRVVMQRHRMLGEMARLCREKGIRLILATYPASYKSANESLRKAAANYGLTLVDNERRFAGLIASASREKYAHGDDHLTAVGYRIMARNVFEGIVNAKALDAPK